MQTILSLAITGLLLLGVVVMCALRLDKMMKAVWKAQSRARTGGRCFNTCFTLIELLVVVAIVGILAAFIIPAVNAARTKGAQAAAKNLDANFYHNLGDSLVGQWLFDDGTVNDTSGMNVVTTNSGGTFTSVTPFGTGQALSLNGSSYVAINGASYDFSATQSFTVAVWLKPDKIQVDTMSADSDVVEKWSGGATGYPFVIRYYNQIAGSGNGKISFARYDGTNNPGVQSLRAINDGNYHFVIATKNGSNLNLYIDGVFNGTAVDTITGITANGTPLYVGVRGTVSNHYSGLVDSLRIYDRALDTSEIQKLYAVDALKHGYAFVGEYNPLVR